MMTQNIDPNAKIIVDSDILIHFIKGDKLGFLPSIFKNKLYFFKEVFDEVFKGDLRIQIENLIKYKQITELSINSDYKVFKEFASLKKKYGSGESACMAYCKFNNDVLASSNLKDVKTYCKVNNIQLLTTMDFLYEAYISKKISEAKCNKFIKDVRSKGSKLPCSTIKQYEALK